MLGAVLGSASLHVTKGGVSVLRIVLFAIELQWNVFNVLISLPTPHEALGNRFSWAKH